ncbi:hypothetical protein WKI71_24245 [Streptomyces sp. MS1.AVA.1]|uniref:Uncharacterized protein n=1 Tax=Streptomyces machairae TaxID=3134109 RepID=A0ABU8UNB8_9ACTN
MAPRVAATFFSTSPVEASSQRTTTEGFSRQSREVLGALSHRPSSTRSWKICRVPELSPG